MTTSSTDLTLVVMAAGIGSRFGGLKQVEPVGPGGEAILDYSVHDAVAAGFGKVVFIIRRDIEEDFKATLGERIGAHVDVGYVYQELSALPAGFAPPPERKKPWGTGHAVLCCKELVHEPFAVINADDFYGAGSFAALARHLRGLDDGARPVDYCMAGYVLGNTLSEHGYVSRGVCTVTEGGLLEGIQERTRIERRGAGAQYSEDGGESWTDLAIDSTVSMNMFGFGPSLFDELEQRFVPFLEGRAAELKSEFFLPSVVMEAMGAGAAQVRVLPTDERWVGVTHKEDLEGVRATIRALIDRGVYAEDLWSR